MIKANFMASFDGLGDIRSKINEHGVLFLDARIVRTGMLDAHAVEVGADDWDAEWKLEFPREEIDRIAAGVEGLPVTIDHDWVSKNESVIIGRVVSKGELEDVDGETYVRVRIAIDDLKIVNRMAHTGEKEFSIGFNYEAERTDFGAIIRNVKLNHVSIVDSARAGREAKVVGFKELTMTKEEVEAKLSETKASLAAKDEKIAELNGEIAGLKHKIAEFDAIDLEAKAKAMVSEHVQFSDFVGKFGKSVNFGDYDKSEVLSAILTEKGIDHDRSDEVFMKGVLSGLMHSKNKRKDEIQIQISGKHGDDVQKSVNNVLSGKF